MVCARFPPSPLRGLNHVFESIPGASPRAKFHRPFGALPGNPGSLVPSHVWRVLRFVCYPPYCFCNFPFPRMGCSLVGGKGKSCRCEILCYGIKGWIRQPVDENRGSIISTSVLIFARSWRKWRDASATVLCQKTVQLSRQRDAESAKWVMTSHF